MINREHIKQAIDAISAKDPDIGYSLNEMLGSGQIDTGTNSGEFSQDDDFYFFFDKQKVRIRKFVYFHEGLVAIEERLLIKYGEMAKKQELLRRSASINYIKASGEIREAGLRLMVNREIDYAIADLQKGLKDKKEERITKKGTPAKFIRGDIDDSKGQLVLLLEKIRRGDPEFYIPEDENNPFFLYKGLIDRDTPAFFMRFPFCMDSLMQVADMNLEFFHVRFLLNCLIGGVGGNLFACSTKGKIVGLVFTVPRQGPFHEGLEIKYMATIRGRIRDPMEPPGQDHKGVGTFLVAGVWLLWKTRLSKVREIFLNAEVEASRFYVSIGFQPRRMCEYVLKDPRGYLLKSILVMTNNCETPGRKVVQEITGLIKKQVKLLRKRPRGGLGKSYRELMISFVKECLLGRVHADFATTALKSIIRYKKRIPEAEDLIRLAVEYGRVRINPLPTVDVQPVIVVCDERFSRHLENIFHLENPRRIRAIQSVLDDASLTGKWSKVETRLATEEELALVHTAAHIERIARTAGKPLVSLDLDTQTSALSYETARLAVGAVFNLLDQIWEGSARRGFAFIRPPGHHAGPNKAMGFCLFNNVALGARYLKNRYKAERIMIVDIDVHHGNGTQSSFYDTNEVLYLSFHQFPAYPGTGNLGEVGLGKGEGFTVNVPLATGHGDRDFEQIIHFLVEPLAREYRPEMLLVSCGFDLYMYDRLGGMKCTPEGYARITSLLVEIAEKLCRGRIAFVLEGGYSIKGIRECGLRVMQELCNISTLRRGIDYRVKGRGGGMPSALEKAIEIHKKYWKILS